MEKRKIIEKSLDEWYSEDPARQKLFDEITAGEAGFSLRSVDWLVTNYSARNGVSYVSSGGVRVADVNGLYRDALRCYHKSCFDAFRRKNDSAVRQRNFFRWAMTNGIVEYAAKNAAAISDDMATFRGKKKKKIAEGGCKKTRDNKPKVIVRDALSKIPNFAAASSSCF